jgi:methylenetetrahydrofolate reductase (NADPH)
MSMARIADLLAAGRTYSFEFSPPGTEAGWMTLGRTIAELDYLNPSFVSVTYGAGGGTRVRTHEAVAWIRKETPVTPMAHLTCVSHTRAQITEILDAYDSVGVENILALAGDPPSDPTKAGPSEYGFALDLVEHVRDHGTFSVGVAAHPEVHPRSTDPEADRDHLAAKLRVADFAITQFFFEVEPYLRLVDDLAARQVDKPVIPGIMPITNIASVARMAQLSGAAIPNWLTDRLEAVADDPDAVRKVGVDTATELARQLLDRGAPGLHFYTLNRSTATREIYANLGLAP